MSRRAHKPPPQPRHEPAARPIGRRWLLAIVLAALAYRVVCFAVVGGHPLFRQPVVDAGHHHAWARRIAAGDLLGHNQDDVFKPPLYAYFLAGLYAVAGPSVAAAQWAQHLLGAASCVFVALLGARLLGRTTGIVAGLLAALYAPSVFFECQLLTPALGIALSLAALLLLIASLDKPHYLRLLAAGALLGLSAGVRPDVLLPAGLVVLFLLLHHLRTRRGPLAASAACIVAGIAAVVLPITARNHHLTGQLIPISSNAGINFYVGNATGADGITAVPVGLRWERHVARMPQHVLEKPAVASRWWARAAWRDIQAAPAAAVARLGAKALAFVNRREFRNNICFHFMLRRAWPLWSPAQYALVLPLAVCGLVALARRPGAPRHAAAVCLLWVGGYAVAGVLFFVTARFRLPAVPLLLVPAAWALAQAAAALRARHTRGLLAAAALFLATGILAWPPWLGGPRPGWVRDQVNLANSLRDARDLRGAQQAYRQALRLDPHDVDAHFLLARTLLPTDPARALEHLEAAHAVLPDSPDLLLTLGHAHRALGQPARARQALHDLLRLADSCNLLVKRAAWANAHIVLADLEPADAQTHRQRAWAIDPHTAAEAAFLQRRDLPRALDTFRAWAHDEPWNWYAQANHAMALLETGRAADAADAADAFRRAARLAPERPALRLHLARALLRAGKAAQAIPLLDRLAAELPDSPLRRQASRLRAEADAAPNP